MHTEDATEYDANRYAGYLLRALGVDVVAAPQGPAAHPALRWAECGAMALTGRRDGPPLMCPVPLAACADGALVALQRVAAAPHGLLPAGAELLAERAALAGLQRNGRISPGGACRLLDCVDGRIALTLARPEDWASLPAWLPEIRLRAEFPRCKESAQSRNTAADWEVVASAVADQECDALVERGRLLSLAIAADRLPDHAPEPWLVIEHECGGGTTARRGPPVVVDLSSLWAGPLCTHLLGLLGAQVIKVESTTRPDGARSGKRAVYDRLNHGKSSVAIDFQSARGRDQLRRLLESADIVIEASRPRALRQLGIDADAICASRRALTWVSLTGHGLRAPQQHWIAFGDDAGVAAGLSALLHRATGETLFCGDAVADPLAGMHAALAAWWSHRRGGSRRISVSLQSVVRACVDFAAPLDAPTLRERQRRWEATARAGPIARYPRFRISSAGPPTIA
ncbi:MAG TPA: CoA transferase [Planctomycetota bacterium]